MFDKDMTESVTRLLTAYRARIDIMNDPSDPDDKDVDEEFWLALDSCYNICGPELGIDPPPDVVEGDAYTNFVNEDRTVLVTRWEDSGTTTVAFRETPGHTWGPPITVTKEA